MARALIAMLVLGAGACKLGPAPAGRCVTDSDCRSGVCRIDGGCGATHCDEGDVIACEAQGRVATRTCAQGSFGLCVSQRCSGLGACGQSFLLLTDDGGCSQASYRAADAGWAMSELCGDGIDNDCDNITDPSPGPCNARPGVCAGVQRRCGDPFDCGAATYLAADSGYEEFEVKCDGLDNDCDGLVDISEERSLGPGTEVTLLAEYLTSAPAAYRTITAVELPQRIRSRYWTGSLEPAGPVHLDVAALGQAVPRTMVNAAQGSAGTYITWRVANGLAAKLMNPNGNSLDRGTVTGNVTNGPRVVAPYRDGGADDAVLIWTQPGELYLSPLRATAGSMLPQPTMCNFDNDPRFDCLPSPVTYFDTAQEGLPTLVFGLTLADGGVGHLATFITIPAEGDPGGCGTIPNFIRVGPLCLFFPFPDLAALGVRVERAAPQAWIAQNGADLRVVLGNQDAGGFTRHTVVGLGPQYPVTEVEMPPIEEGALAVGRADAGLAWFIQRSGQRILAVSEGNRDGGLSVMLSDAGVNAPAIAWSLRQPGHYAVAYVVARPDGGEVMGRLLCAPR